MNSLTKRALTLCTALFGLFLGTVPALAGGGGIWTDISGRLDIRTNRLVWASASAGNATYLTDGQAFASGGRVWRMNDNGAIAVINTELQNTGLIRVDDIVSDGSTILFLQNITQHTPTFSIIGYRQGGYFNPSSVLSSYLAWNEGIASITGKNNLWSVVTTNGRVLFWNSLTNDVQLFLTTPNGYSSSIAYSVRHASPADGLNYLPVAAAPISTGWLVASRDSGNGVTRIWTRNPDGMSADYTAVFGNMQTVLAMFSNGSNAFVIGTNGNPGETPHVWNYDGSRLLDLSSAFAGAQPGFNWSNAIAASVGNKWFIVSGKQSIIFDGASVYSTTAPIDRFYTMSVNGRDHFILGGAVSNENSFDPTLPLTAKLMDVSYWGKAEPLTTTSASNASGLRAEQWLTPAATTVRQGTQATFNVRATDVRGIKRADLVVNGRVVKSCVWSRKTKSATCSTTLSGSNYAVGTVVSMNAKVTNWRSTSVWTPLLYVTITDAAPTPTPNTTPKTWIWTTPDESATLNQSRTFHVGAWDGEGMSSLEIWVNGTNRRTCPFNTTYGNVECNYTVNAWEYPAGTNVFVNARAVDATGQATWSDSKSYYVPTSNTQTYYPYPGYTPSYPYYPTYPIYPTPVYPTPYYPPTPGTVTTPPSGYTGDPNTISASVSGQFATFNVNANDVNGTKSIQIYVNGQSVQTCTYTTNCSWTGGPYSSGTIVNYAALTMGSTGATSWTGYKTVNF